jgi:hypothetical protein
MAAGSLALKGLSSRCRSGALSSSSGWRCSISSALRNPVPATLLCSSSPATEAFALSTSLPTSDSASPQVKAQPPSRVSELEPGEICASPQPMRPSASRTSTRIGSNDSNVR